MNIIYTVLNSGWDEFSFYCDDKYDNCYNDINELAKDEEILGNIIHIDADDFSYQTDEKLLKKIDEIILIK